MKKVFAYFLFTLFVSFTIIITTYSFWGDSETLISISISEEEEEEEQPSPANEESKEYLSNDFVFVQKDQFLHSQQNSQFEILHYMFEDVYFQTIYSPPDKLA